MSQRISFIQKWFRVWSATESDGVVYLKNLVEFNLAEARRFANKKSYGWKNFVRDHLAAVFAAKALLRERGM